MTKKESPKCGNFPSWTESKFNSFIKSALRTASSRWPPKYEALKNAYLGVKENKKTGRQAKHYRCNSCYGEFPSSEVQVDHIQPVIDPFKGFVSWDEVIKRMFCSVLNFQVLCKPCHVEKSNAEKRQAKERKSNENRN